ncbi:hypothetical protein BKN38_05940 [Helicobacter sp. CLO-3]|uniref:hypothetical protein n=1 Tax=unclassified Helicobacter TaxID=2593540 RepID=UPI000804F758|nr:MULTISPECIES: hypothetical protein [unclassified Helicobacter]OBV29490.1 hypothetical protein BA723_05430 [Helicobacter sp. CLO-3]OHU83076.1 hypothetical protein BKN38_05940 [Helicobacter sp. CLO-3]
MKDLNLRVLNYGINLKKKLRALLYVFGLSLRILTLFVLALSLNACPFYPPGRKVYSEIPSPKPPSFTLIQTNNTIQTNIPTIEVKFQPIKQLTKQEYNNIFYKQKSEYYLSKASSPHFTNLASTNKEYVVYCNNERLQILDADNDLRELQEYSHIKCSDYGGAAFSFSASLSPNNKYLIVNYNDSSQIYDFKTQELIYNNPNARIFIVDIFLDNEIILAGNNDWIVFTNEFSQRFAVKEIDKDFINLNEEEKIYIFSAFFKDGNIYILFRHSNISTENDPAYYYLAKLVPINKNKE